MNSLIISSMLTSHADMHKLRSRLEQVRKYAGLSMDDFAQLFKLSPSELERKIEKAEDFPDEIFYLLHERYHLSLRWLMKGEGCMRSFGPNSRLRAFAKVGKNRNAGGLAAAYTHAVPEKSGNPEAYVHELHKKLEQLSDKLENHLFPLRKTLMKLTGVDTFDDHRRLSQEIKNMQHKLYFGSQAHIKELIEAIPQLEEQILENRQSLHMLLEHELSTPVHEMPSGNDQWSVHRKSI